MNGEPGAAVLSIFDQLIERIKQRTPRRTDSKPVNSRVYSQLVLGMPIWKDDYFRPFSPAGGSSLMDTFPPPPPGAAGTPTPPPALDPKALRAMQAAWKTSLLCRTMLQVTKDDEYKEYPTGRHLDIAYDTVIEGMQPGAMTDLAPDVKARLAEAQKVLYKLDADGNVEANTPVYDNYLNNTQALAAAKANFAAEFALARRDPVKFEIFPVQSAVFQQAVDNARNKLISQGAERVERALDVIGSIGRPMQANMIRKAKAAFDAWNLGLSGSVPEPAPFSLILPTNWCDPDDHQGFETIVVDEAEINHFSSHSELSAGAQSWQRHAERSGGGGGVVLGFAAFGGSHGTSSSSSSFQNSTSAQFQSQFKNTAKNLHIELEFGLCTIVRPWLVSDVFFLKNWFLAGAKKASVSDGTIDGQADSPDKTLPMIPQQFLVVRNVTISASDWGSDGEVLEQFYGASQGSSQGNTSSTSGAAGVSLGFISFGGRASTSESNASGQSTSFTARSGNSHFGTTFKNQTLKMPGTQIVAFLSDIVPACPDLDDPTLAH